MTLSHLVDGRNQATSSAMTGALCVKPSLTLTLISSNDTRQTDYVIIQTIFFVSFTQNTYAVIFIQNFCCLLRMDYIVANIIGVSFDLISIVRVIYIDNVNKRIRILFINKTPVIAALL
jgi:hypothetical protein